FLLCPRAGHGKLSVAPVQLALYFVVPVRRERELDGEGAVGPCQVVQYEADVPLRDGLHLDRHGVEVRRDLRGGLAVDRRYSRGDGERTLRAFGKRQRPDTHELRRVSGRDSGLRGGRGDGGEQERESERERKRSAAKKSGHG